MGTLQKRPAPLENRKHLLLAIEGEQDPPKHATYATPEVLSENSCCYRSLTPEVLSENGDDDAT